MGAVTSSVVTSDLHTALACAPASAVHAPAPERSAPAESAPAALLADGFIESFERRYPRYILETLLADHTTHKNIIWADGEYEQLGEGYAAEDEITCDAIAGTNSGVIKPRVLKARERQSKRTKTHAEVFTPSWLVNYMVSALDEDWFGRSGVFTLPAHDNANQDEAELARAPWKSSLARVEFPHTRGRGWRDYVCSKRLEITCGEAPFLCSRYDTVMGDALPVPQRIGVLDRKLRVVSERARTRPEWVKWALAALRATYGYEYQGDNLLIARINCLETFVEHCIERWGAPPTPQDVHNAAWIISWNLWQMNGLTCAVPTTKLDASVQSTLFDYVAPVQEPLQMALFDASEAVAKQPTPSETLQVQLPIEHARVPLCVIYDWENDEPIEFASLKGKVSKDMGKFYAIIGNPPYQEETEGTSDKPIYNSFMDECYQAAERVELITPGRFLFNAGKTPKEWNKKMLEDPHLEVLKYEQDSSKVFPNTDIKGGVVVTYHDISKEAGPIEVFSLFDELRTIRRKVTSSLDDGCITDFMHLQNRFDLNALYTDYPEAKDIISSDGHERRIVTSSFNKLAVFTDTKETPDSIHILGLAQPGNKRVFKWIQRKYVEDNGNLEKYKVILPMANGSGALGEVLSTPLIGEPLIGYTQSFLGIGACDTREEAESILKYVKTKFARVLLGILKITQHNTPEKWKFVPLQDFTSSSDIDWSQSVAEIDVQLYKKYGLTDGEIAFIESHVKEMN